MKTGEPKYDIEYNQNNYGTTDQNNNVFESKQIHFEASLRLGFIRKVYGILSIQLLITTFFCSLSVLSTSFAMFQINNPGFFWLSMIGSIILVIILVCFRSTARTVPLNYILLITFTLFEAYLVSGVCAMTKPRLVFMAAAMTCAITFALTLYAWTTEEDFTIYGGLLFILACIMFLFGIFLIFTNNKILHIIYCCFGVLLYSFYLIYDTQLIVGNHENKLEIDDYILGALMLYLDVINLFLYLLRILKAADS